MWGEGGGDTTLLNNCGASPIKNSKVSLKGKKSCFADMEEIHFKGGVWLKALFFVDLHAIMTQLSCSKMTAT